MQDPGRPAWFVTLFPRLVGATQSLRVFRCASVARRDRARRLADRGLSDRALANRHLADRSLFAWINRHGLPTRQIRSVCSRHQSKRGTQSNHNLLHSHTPTRFGLNAAMPCPQTRLTRAAECDDSAAGAGHVGGIDRAARRCDVSGCFAARSAECSPDERSDIRWLCGSLVPDVASLIRATRPVVLNRSGSGCS